MREGLNLPSFSIGGGQENGRRAGTEAVHQIVGIGAAAEFVKDFSAMEKVRALRDKLENEILEKIPNSRLNGTCDTDKTSAEHIKYFLSKSQRRSDSRQTQRFGFCVSTGSACNAETHTASPVMQAMNIPYSQAMGAIRFSLGRYNTEAEVDFVLENLPKIIKDLEKLGFSP